MIKAVIDTNVWISALLNPYGLPAKLRQSFEKDMFLIETAIKGQVQYLVTGDNDIKSDQKILLYLLKYGIQVIPINNFFIVLNNNIF